METLNKLLAIDINYIIIALIVVFYTMETLFTTPFIFNGKEFVEGRKQTFWNLVRSPFMNFKRISSEELRKRT